MNSLKWSPNIIGFYSKNNVTQYDNVTVTVAKMNGDNDEEVRNKTQKVEISSIVVYIE